MPQSDSWSADARPLRGTDNATQIESLLEIKKKKKKKKKFPAPATRMKFANMASS
jgi:hypothetical protein